MTCDRQSPATAHADRLRSDETLFPAPSVLHPCRLLLESQTLLATLQSRPLSPNPLGSRNDPDVLHSIINNLEVAYERIESRVKDWPRSRWAVDPMVNKVRPDIVSTWKAANQHVASTQPDAWDRMRGSMRLLLHLQDDQHEAPSSPTYMATDASPGQATYMERAKAAEEAWMKDCVTARYVGVYVPLYSCVWRNDLKEEESGGASIDPQASETRYFGADLVGLKVLVRQEDPPHSGEEYRTILSDVAAQFGRTLADY